MLMDTCLIAALYHFVSLPDYQAMREPLYDVCQRNGVTGTLLLAHEGINGTIAGSDEGIHAVLAYLRADPRLAALEHKESRANNSPFYRLKVRCRREIVTMGVDSIDPSTMAGTYVTPADWNDLITDPDVVVVDVRNDYEVDIGTFDSAVNPHTATFSEFPDWVERESKPGGALHGKQGVAMFCTGGIRCEKSTAYMRSQGFDNVYHLQGGILKYLETVPAEQSRWQGDCFVFDERVAVGHGLERGDYHFCRGCRRPINSDAMASSLYEEGVSCPHCHAGLTDERRERLRERQRQVVLARQRNERHIGESVEHKRAQARARAAAAQEARRMLALQQSHMHKAKPASDRSAG